MDESSFFVSASKPDHQHELNLTALKEFLNYKNIYIYLRTIYAKLNAQNAQKSAYKPH